MPLDHEEAGDPAALPDPGQRQRDPAAARFCESVESGHSAHGDAAAIAERLGIAAPPVRMDSQAKYAVVAGRGRDLPPDAHPGRLPREDLGPCRRGPDRRGGRRDRHRHHGRPLEFHHGRELAANRGVIVTNGRLHERVLEVLRTLGSAWRARSTRRAG